MSEETQIFTRWVDPTIDDFKIALEEANKQIEEDNKEIERLHSIIKEARKYIKNHLERENFDYDILETNTIYNRDLYKVLKILDKVGETDDSKRDV